eukprot:TRINITY_DN541_c0_g1_i2.p1 TRINITY_DN541_c0_g1~~TRINITY_DN541_c0_g1_i2.p1  ORF type:complete len:202 (-),score=50.22 TRINITY_DN541_c0_g1_i2:298-903(-)
MDERVYEAKVVLLGDTGVGKSCIVVRFVNQTFNEQTESTIGATFLTKACVLRPRGPTIKFQVWDTAGQERYLSLAPIYYRSAQAAIVVYDVTNASSFGTMKNWVMELQKFGPPGILVTIAGNKVDLEEARQVSYEKGKAYADDIGALFYECSAKTEDNITEMFEAIGERLPKKQTEPAPMSVISLMAEKDHEKGKKKKGCC